MKNHTPKIKGNLDIFIIQNDDADEDEDNGEIRTWQEVLIHGDPEGLRSLAKLLIKLADLNQDNDPTLPKGAREHYHLDPDRELSNSSQRVIIGRLDAKGTGAFYARFVPAKK